MNISGTASFRGSRESISSSTSLWNSTDSQADLVKSRHRQNSNRKPVKQKNGKRPGWKLSRQGTLEQKVRDLQTRIASHESDLFKHTQALNEMQDNISGVYVIEQQDMNAVRQEMDKMNRNVGRVFDAALLHRAIADTREDIHNTRNAITFQRLTDSVLANSSKNPLTLEVAKQGPPKNDMRVNISNKVSRGNSPEKLLREERKSYNQDLPFPERTEALAQELVEQHREEVKRLVECKEKLDGVKQSGAKNKELVAENSTKKLMMEEGMEDLRTHNIHSRFKHFFGVTPNLTREDLRAMAWFYEYAKLKTAVESADIKMAEIEIKIQNDPEGKCPELTDDLRRFMDVKIDALRQLPNATKRADEFEKIAFRKKDKLHYEQAQKYRSDMLVDLQNQYKKACKEESDAESIYFQTERNCFNKKIAFRDKFGDQRGNDYIILTNSFLERCINTYENHPQIESFKKLINSNKISAEEFMREYLKARYANQHLVAYRNALERPSIQVKNLQEIENIKKEYRSKSDQAIKEGKTYVEVNNIEEEAAQVVANLYKEYHAACAADPMSKQYRQYDQMKPDELISTFKEKIMEDCLKIREQFETNVKNLDGFIKNPLRLIETYDRFHKESELVIYHDLGANKKEYGSALKNLENKKKDYKYEDKNSLEIKYELKNLKIQKQGSKNAFHLANQIVENIGDQFYQNDNFRQKIDDAIYSFAIGSNREHLEKIMLNIYQEEKDRIVTNYKLNDFEGGALKMLKKLEDNHQLTVFTIVAPEQEAAENAATSAIQIKSTSKQIKQQAPKKPAEALQSDAVSTESDVKSNTEKAPVKTEEQIFKDEIHQLRSERNDALNELYTKHQACVKAKHKLDEMQREVERLAIIKPKETEELNSLEALQQQPNTHQTSIDDFLNQMFAEKQLADGFESGSEDKDQSEKEQQQKTKKSETPAALYAT